MTSWKGEEENGDVKKDGGALVSGSAVCINHEFMDGVVDFPWFRRHLIG